MLADEGFVVSFTDDTGDEHEESFKQREFEKRFFSDATNQVFCKTFLENALRDPVSGEVGKSIVFAVSQNHAARLTQTLNEMADLMFPGKYQSDFAVQVTSQVPDAQQFTINFANNNLMGSGNFLSSYRTSKARVCVTVGMMTTGYDCTDILNLGLFRPIFSPTDFVQIKGRGTRRHSFLEQLHDPEIADGVAHPDKTAFKLLDFFANCEYFETEFNYDQVIELPRPQSGKDEGGGSGEGPTVVYAYEHLGKDILATIRQETIGYEGMKIDRMLFDRFADAVRANGVVKKAIEAGNWDLVVDYVNREVFDKPEDYYSLDKLRKAASVDRRLTLREILEKVFDLIPAFKSKDELLEEEFNKFVADHKPEDSGSIPAIRTFFKAYVTSDLTRHVIDSRQYTDLAANPMLSIEDYRAVAPKVPDAGSRLHQRLRIAEPVRRVEENMLDVDTKCRIDTARDLLVGKVPDPKSQVEQITIALICKFMNDLDGESEELGGERKFFAGEFARYGWAKLMGPGIGGYEMLNLYAEAITRMPENPGIPPLGHVPSSGVRVRHRVAVV